MTTTRNSRSAEMSRTTSVLFVVFFGALVASIPVAGIVDRTLDAGRLVAASLCVGGIAGLPVYVFLNRRRDYRLSGERFLAMAFGFAISCIVGIDTGFLANAFVHRRPGRQFEGFLTGQKWSQRAQSFRVYFSVPPYGSGSFTGSELQADGFKYGEKVRIEGHVGFLNYLIVSDGTIERLRRTLDKADQRADFGHASD